MTSRTTNPSTHPMGKSSHRGLSRSDLRVLFFTHGSKSLAFPRPARSATGISGDLPSTTNMEPANHPITGAAASAAALGRGTRRRRSSISIPFCPEEPDLNWENPATRAAIYESAWNTDYARASMASESIRSTCTARRPDFRMHPSPTTQFRGRLLGLSTLGQLARMHEYFRELNQVLEKYGAMTISELPDTPELADVLSYVSANEWQLSMVFQFDIVDVGVGNDLRYDTVPRNWTLQDLRQAAQRVQNVMNRTDGWTTAFLENHDQARSISRFGCEKTPELWERGEKILAMFVASLSGTLYVYQGQEIGIVKHRRRGPSPNARMWIVAITTSMCNKRRATTPGHWGMRKTPSNTWLETTHGCPSSFDHASAYRNGCIIIFM